MRNKLKILQIVKTSDGAWWALEQVRELISYGHEVTIVLPTQQGKFVEAWKSTGANIVFQNLDFPVSNPFKIFKRISTAKKIINDVKPDIIHSHFFGTTIVLRLALLGNNTPFIFQVPGPLHLENFIFRWWEILSARKEDTWIASSKYIKSLYMKYGIDESRLSLSYYGSNYKSFEKNPSTSIRQKYSYDNSSYCVGNVSYIYRPKQYLLQFTGLKNHETIIESISLANNSDNNIKGLLIGGEWGDKTSYEAKLQKIASHSSHGNINITGKIPPQLAHDGWNNLDLAIHIPHSENCGGVIEPLLSGIPVIASNTGGLKEVIIHNKTGIIVDKDNPKEISEKIVYAYNHQKELEEMTRRGAKLVEHMFDVKRTAKEIERIYLYRLNLIDSPPDEFDSIKYLNEAQV